MTGFASLPRWLAVPAALGLALIVIPLVGMATRIPWSEFGSLITSSSARDALWLSLRTSALATVGCVIGGVPLAAYLARGQGPVVTIVRSLTSLPLVLPPVVGGLALLYTFGRTGLIGKQLSAWGIDVAFSTTAVVIAQTFVALPFLVMSLESSMRSAGDRYERAATGLGASPTVVFWRITLPVLAPAIASGAVLSFARALGEFGATLTFAGSLQGITRTLPLEIYLERETDPQAAVALSVLLMVVAFAVVAALRARPTT